MNPGQAPPPNLPRSSTPRRHWSRRKRLSVLFVTLLLVYFGVTYLAVPAVWERYAHRHPKLEDIPGITTEVRRLEENQQQAQTPVNQQIKVAPPLKTK